MKKRGQFYLIAAIVIIGVIIGFASVANYVKQKGDNVVVYDLAEEIGFESGEVFEYGQTNLEDSELESLITHSTAIYQERAGEGIELFFVFGTQGGLVAYSYEEVNTGDITITPPGSVGSAITLKKKVKRDIAPTTANGKIKVKVKEVDYEFDLEEGENFYFIVSQEVGDENYVVEG